MKYVQTKIKLNQIELKWFDCFVMFDKLSSLLLSFLNIETFSFWIFKYWCFKY